jgi:hypothetical protein
MIDNMTDSVDVDDGGSSQDEDSNIFVDANVNIEKENRQAHQEFREFFEVIQIFVFEQPSDCEE